MKYGLCSAASLLVILLVPASSALFATDVPPELSPEVSNFYSLDESVTMRVVQAPFPASRRELQRRGGPPDGPARLIFKADRDGAIRHSGTVYGPETLETLLSALDFDPATLEIPDEIRNLSVPGDVVVLSSANTVIRAESLEQILQSQFNLPLELEYRTDAQTVVVARGRYQLHPLKLEDPRGPRIHVFLHEPSADLDRSAGAGTTDLSGFLTYLGRHLGVTVVNEVAENPEPVTWRFDDSSAKTLHLEEVLELVASQTALEFELETRPTETLYIRRAE